MNFAILGENPAVLPVARAIIESRAHKLTHAVAPANTDAATLATAAPALRIVTAWEELLNAPEIDVVVIGTHDEVLLQGAKQLASAGKSVLLLPDKRQDSAWVYEMTLIRDDNRVVLLPHFPLRDDPRVVALKSAIAGGKLGNVLHLQMEREIVVRDDGPAAPLLPVDTVNAELLFDVDLLRAIGGSYNRITALHSGTIDRRVSLATVTLAGNDLPEASWTARPVTTASRWTLRVVGEKGQLTLTGDGEGIRLEGLDVEVAPAGESEAAGSAEHTLSRLEAAMNGETVTPDWTDLTRAFEVVDATARSLRRRRTIDLHFETASERNQFKTQMTAIGCGLISITLVSVIFLLIFAKIFNLHPTLMSIARIGVFVPLVLFLLLQLLLFITRPPAEKTRSDSESPG